MKDKDRRYMLELTGNYDAHQRRRFTVLMFGLARHKDGIGKDGMIVSFSKALMDKQRQNLITRRMIIKVHRAVLKEAIKPQRREE